MKITHLPHNESSVFFVKRFRQLLWGTLLLAVLSILNVLLASNGAAPLTVVSLLVLVSIIMLAFYLIKINKESLARTIFLWAVAIGVVYISWVNGGLRDSAALSYPLIIIFSALIGGFRIFLSIFAFMIVAIIALGFSTVYNLNPHPLNPFGLEQVLDSLLMAVLAAYVASTVYTDMSSTLKRLGLENIKAIRSKETIQLLSERDPLTGLLNRSACEVHFRGLSDQLDDSETLIMLFFIDLDNFKNINDSFGHNAGDELLTAISNGLKKLLQDSDAACRLGGDEFVLIAKRDKKFDTNKLADKLLEVITTPYYVFGTTIRMTGSVGIAISPNDGKVFDEISKRADIAMYKSKQLGKNRYSYFSSHLQEETLRKTSILNGLKDALEHDLLDLHVQPKINLLTGKTESAEALLRWNRSNPYNFKPDEFIPVLESTELIHEIGQWCIEEACRICKRWHDAGHHNMSIAVNVSSVQFMRDNFNTLVFNALEESGLEARFLEIELTEHVLIQHNQTIDKQLKSLKDIGIKLSIDDFGTGYSNLSYLINFKVDTIKLDKSFISELNSSKDHYAVVKAVIQMAQILNLKVVAEGVESQEIKDILMNLKCDFAQGFLWSKAIPEHTFISAVTQLDLQAQ